MSVMENHIRHRNVGPEVKEVLGVGSNQVLHKSTLVTGPEDNNLKVGDVKDGYGYELTSNRITVIIQRIMNYNVSGFLVKVTFCTNEWMLLLYF